MNFPVVALQYYADDLPVGKSTLPPPDVSIKSLVRREVNFFQRGAGEGVMFCAAPAQFSQGGLCAKLRAVQSAPHGSISRPMQEAALGAASGADSTREALS